MFKASGMFRRAKWPIVTDILKYLLLSSWKSGIPSKVIILGLGFEGITIVNYSRDNISPRRLASLVITAKISFY
jgi:hypothetical protein